MRGGKSGARPPLRGVWSGRAPDRLRGPAGRPGRRPRRPCGPGPRDLAGRTAGPAWLWPVLPWSWRGLAWSGCAWPGLALTVLAGLGARPAGSLSGWRSACRGQPVLVGPWPLQAVLAGAAGPSPGPGGPSPEPTGSAWPWRAWPGRSGPCRAVRVPAGLGPARALWPGGRVLALRTRGPWTSPGPDGSGPWTSPGPGGRRSGLPAGASDPSVGRSCAARSGGPGPLPGGRASPGPGTVARTGRDP